jgi:hypothetical protein
MELEEFIKTTLINIKKGINNANVELAKIDGKELGKDAGAVFVIYSIKDNKIEFNVAVTTTKEGSGSGKINIAAVSIGGEKNHSEEYASRIKFSVGLHTDIA